jgi:hypothetical protein
MNTVAGLPPGSLEFALPHAVNLAEAGSSIEERKAGTFYAALIHLVCPSLCQGIFSAPRQCRRVMI